MQNCSKLFLLNEIFKNESNVLVTELFSRLLNSMIIFTFYFEVENF